MEADSRQKKVEMTEKINGQGFSPAEAGGVRRWKQMGSARGGAGRRKGDGNGDALYVEATQLLVNRLEDEFADAPVVDAERVRAIRDAIASGSYQIDACSIAEKMIHLEDEFKTRDPSGSGARERLPAEKQGC